LLNHISNHNVPITRSTVAIVATITIIFLTTAIFLFTPSPIIAQLSVPTNPLEAKGGTPPQIAMVYNGKEYLGNLVNYIANSTNSNTTGTTAPVGQSAVTSQNITAPLPSKVVTVKKGSVINFVLLNKNDTSIKTIPSSMSITAYNIKGKATGLANTIEHSKTSKFVVNLNVGTQYILLPVATWIAQKGSIGTTNAFVSYSYRINVIG
jgi:hypothetical protein